MKMRDLILKVESLANLETENSAYVSRPLLAYMNKWLTFSDEEKSQTISELKAALTDGLDIDFTGTQWEAEWLENGKICKCKACKTGRECLQILEGNYA